MKLLRVLLFPFSILYDVITSIRNYFYDRGWFTSKSYDIPVICVGNLSTGGTGKSPMVQFLIEFLRKDFRVGVLSRGYKRKTSGYLEVHSDSTAFDVGDEPLQFKQNYPEAIVAVCADRREGILRLKEKVDLIILDDAFQHRRVKASTYILLTPFDDLYVDDYLLPTGNLREGRVGARRADIVVVTKCPEGVAYSELQKIQHRLKLLPEQRVYFSKIGYEKMIYGASETLHLSYLQDKRFTLVTGIANPKPLVDFLNRSHFSFEHLKFADHHEFSVSEIAKLKKKEIILTTEKDFMRLHPELGKYALYYLPIKTQILNDQEGFFIQRILQEIDEARFS